MQTEANFDSENGFDFIGYRVSFTYALMNYTFRFPKIE